MKHDAGHAFKCLGWSYPATFIFLLFETPNVTLRLLAPRNTCCVNACIGEHVSSKYGTWYSERHFAIYVHLLLGWRYISSLHSADESQEGQNSFPVLRSCFIGSYHVWCLETSFTKYQACSLLFETGAPFGRSLFV